MMLTTIFLHFLCYSVVYCNLHDGNILVLDDHDELFIIDLGLCKPINTLQNDDNVYGVLPYIAPEILRRGSYTAASDIYSFSMIKIYISIPGKGVLKS